MAGRRSDLLAVAASLALDSMTGELVGELRRAGVPAVVLKGPAVRSRLYDGSEPRPHEDIDLLVSPADTERAERHLAERGFRFAAASRHARAWIRREDGVTVDLHGTLVGVEAPPEDAWKVLLAETEPMTLGGLEVSVLGAAGTALHVALHAAQHGIRGGKSIEDLRRALERCPPEVWRAARELAERLEAAPAFAAGLRLLPEGRALSDRLGLATRATPETALRAATAPPTALGFQRLMATVGLRAKGALVAGELAPPPAFMRALYPWARRGRVALAASYIWRPFWLLRHAGPAIRAWQRARRDSRP